MQAISKLPKAELVKIVADIQAALYLTTDDDDPDEGDCFDPDKSWDSDTLGRVAEILHNHKLAPTEKVPCS